MSSQAPPVYHQINTASSYFDSTPSSSLLPNPAHDDFTSSSSSPPPSSSSSSPPSSSNSFRSCRGRSCCFRVSWLLLNVLLLILSLVLVVFDYKKLLRSTLYTTLHLGSQAHRVPHGILVMGIVSIVLSCLGIVLSICCKRVWPAPPSATVSSSSFTPVPSSSSYAAAPSATAPSRLSRPLRLYLLFVLLTAIVLVVLGSLMLKSARKPVSTQITKAWVNLDNNNRISLQGKYGCCGLNAFNDTYAGLPCPTTSYSKYCLPALEAEFKRKHKETGGVAIGVSTFLFVSVWMWMVRRCLQRRAEKREAAARDAAIVSSPSNFYLPTATPV